MCAVIASAQTEILCGRRMAGLKEPRETMLSCALKNSAADLRGTSEHTKCRGNHERGEGHVAAHRTLTHAQQTTVESHRCTACWRTHTTRRHVLTLALTLVGDSKISSQTQIANICSLFWRQRPFQHLPQIVSMQCSANSQEEFGFKAELTDI